MQMRRPSPRLWHVRLLQLGATALVAAVVASAALAAGGATASAWVASLAVLVAAGGTGGAVLRRRVQAWGYTERAEDLVVVRGVFVRRLTVVPYGRMQLIDVTAGPVERAFGLSTVRLHTAAAATDARVPGLRADEAARLRDTLAHLGEARTTGL